MNGYTPEAFSRLGLILSQRNLSVLALQRKLEDAGAPVNVKSLYRLAEDAPLQKIDLRIAAAICKACGLELGDLISFEKPQAQLQRLDAKTQSRLDALMEKNNDGKLSAAERKEFSALADHAHALSMANARLLVAGRKRAGARTVQAKAARKPATAAARK